MVHAALSGASPAALKKLETLRKRREHRETWPVEKQVVRLPASSGAPPAIELEDADDFLQVVLDHRRAPPNDKMLVVICLIVPLLCNQPVNRNPGCLSQDGFGSYSTDPVAKEHRSNRRKRGSKRGSKWQTRSNPALQTTPAAEDKLPQIESEVRSAPLSLPHSASAPAGSGGVFFQTEVELEEGNAQKLGKPTMLKTSSLPSVASLPSLTEKGKEGRLEELSEMSTEWKPYPSESVSLVEPSEELQKITAPSPQCAERAGDKDQKKIQAQRLMRAFHKAVDGRSVLILTDQSDVRKSIMRSLMCAINEMSICFTCSTADLWKRLQGKEVFHALLVDLSKADLEVEGLVKTIRADPQYGNLPIIVLSQERELPDLVRQSCSFVVFQPLSASMLREALLWCFNRSALKHQSYYWPAPAVAPLKRSGNISKAPNLTVRARQLKNR
eukprot:Skav232257  [mRNA]  locus=scaffold273:165042:167467:- [translate_table: standard]